MRKPRLDTQLVEEYLKLSLLKMEEAKLKLLNQRTSTEPTETAKRRDTARRSRALDAAIKQACKKIKAEVMTFEGVNYGYLLIYRSTDGYYKMAGHSVIFYSLIIAPRLGRRFYLRPDDDSYSKSDEGVISIKNLKQLSEQMLSLGITLEKTRSTDDIFYFKLKRNYTESEYEKLFAKSEQENKRMASILRPEGPLPRLYISLMELFELAMRYARSGTDVLERQLAEENLIKDAGIMIRTYHDYAGARGKLTLFYLDGLLDVRVPAGCEPTSTRARLLLEIAARSCRLHDSCALLEHRYSTRRKILVELMTVNIEVQRMAVSEYLRLIKKEQQTLKEAKSDQKKHKAAKEATQE